MSTARPASAPSAVAPGTVLAGRYRVHREIGHGGMGVVYLCRDQSKGDAVALKRLYRPDAPLDQEDVWWFYQEARALASLDHPSIVRARDFGVLADGSPFLVMELARGRSLLEWLEIAAIPWPWPRTVLWSFVDQILSALAHAHARAVIHGDLKPTNVMIDFAAPGTLPRVSILDFGLASLIYDRLDHRLDGRASHETPRVRAGAGTPGWMAPEQILRMTPHYGPPTDLYALGSILYHLLCGREPFTGPAEEVLEGHRSKPIPPLQLPPNAPDGMRAFTMRLLEKRPWRRFEYAADAQRAWAPFRPSVPVEPWSFRRLPGPRGVDALEIDTQIVSDPAGTGAAAEIPAMAAFAPGLLGLRPSPFVAREEETAALRDLVESAASPDRPAHQLVCLVGEAGVGKSRLAEWACEFAHEAGAMVPLRARYRRIPAPLDGVRGAVIAHYGLERADRNVVEAALLDRWEVGPDDDVQRTWVAAAAEWLRPTPPGTVLLPGPSGKRFFFDTDEVRWLVIRQVLEHVGAVRPLLLWLDDLHLASARTFDLLARLHEDSPALRFVLLATARAETVSVDAQAAARLDALRAVYGGRVLEVRTLSDDATERLVLESLPLDDAAVREAKVRSRGNPLFALQVLHAWASSGGLVPHGDRYRVPAEALRARAGTTSELWEERLEGIPAEHRRAALAASALGGDIHEAVLRALLLAIGVPVGAAASALQRAHILLPAGPDRLRWPHALLQEHLLERLLAEPANAVVFRAAADAMAWHPAAGTRRVVGHRVTNLLRAGDHEAAADLILSFVERAWRRVRDVGASLNDLGRLEGLVLSPPKAAALARWKAEALRHAGRFAEARELAESARATFAALGDAKDEAHCLRLLGHIVSEQAVPQGRDFATAAFERFDALNDEAGRAEAELVLGEIDYLLGAHDAAREELGRAEERCATVGDSLGLAQSFILQSLIEQAGWNLPRSRELLERARTQFEALGYRLGIAQCEVALAHVEHRSGDLEAATQHGQNAARQARDLRNPRCEAAAERLLAMAHLDGGDLRSAQERALAATAIYDRIGDPWGQVEGRLLVAQISLAAGDPGARDIVVSCLHVGLVEAEPQQHLALTLAWLAHQEARWDDAVAAVQAAQEAFGDSKRTGDHTPHLLSRLAAMEWPEPARTIVDDWWRELGGF